MSYRNFEIMAILVITTLASLLTVFRPARAAADAPDVVKLGRLNAVAVGSEVRLDWTTLSEIDLVGFNLYRKQVVDGQVTSGSMLVVNASGLIPAQDPGASTGWHYSWVDKDAQGGVVYYYWLEWVRTAGEPLLVGPMTIPTGYNAWVPISR